MAAQISSIKKKKVIEGGEGVEHVDICSFYKATQVFIFRKVNIKDKESNRVDV